MVAKGKKVSMNNRDKPKKSHIFTTNEVSNAIKQTHEKNYRNNNADKFRKPIVGTNKSISTVKSVLKLGYLHVYRLQPSTTPENLRDILSTTASTIDFYCEQLFKNDKTCVYEIEHVKDVYNPNIWPEGALVNRFRFRRNFRVQASDQQAEL